MDNCKQAGFDTILARLADCLGYDRIEWDADHGCYSGYGSSDSFDRSRDDGCYFVASDPDELAQLAQLARWHGIA